MHRRVFRWRRKDRLVAAGHVIARVLLLLVALLVTGIAIFVFDVVVGRGAAVTVGSAMVLLAIASLVLLPRVVGGHRPAPLDPDDGAVR